MGSILIVLILLLLLGGGGYYWTRPGWRFGGPDMVGLIVTLLLIVALLKVLGVF